VPGDGNVKEGEADVDVPALPNVHARDTITPSLSVLRSTNVHVRSAHDESKSAVGALFDGGDGGAATVTVVLSVSDKPFESVMVRVTVYEPAAV
jgi:hypothetical protein